MLWHLLLSSTAVMLSSAEPVELVHLMEGGAARSHHCLHPLPLLPPLPPLLHALIVDAIDSLVALRTKSMRRSRGGGGKHDGGEGT